MTSHPITPGDGDPRHGTPNGYCNLCCHCQDCRDAHAAKTAEIRAVRKTRTIPDFVRHGSNTYLNWGCRCSICSTDHSRVRRGRAC